VPLVVYSDCCIARFIARDSMRVSCTRYEAQNAENVNQIMTEMLGKYCRWLLNGVHAL